MLSYGIDLLVFRKPGKQLDAVGMPFSMGVDIIAESAFPVQDISHIFQWQLIRLDTVGG